MTDLTVATFITLRKAFFEDGATPRPYKLRHKGNVQDDPLDEYIQKLLDGSCDDAGCFKAAALTTPDLVVLRPEACEGTPRAALRADSTRIVGIEVKKIKRSGKGKVARASGADFNTTPPCGTVRVYDRTSQPLEIKGFYMFVCEEPLGKQRYQLTALALCDGDLLNADFELYSSIVGERTKGTGLGTYKDGANRERPMMIFTNPLGAAVLDHQVTLVHSRADLEQEFPDIRLAGVITRTIPGDHPPRRFHCYRAKADIQEGQAPFDVTDPFPVPKRTDRTQARGKFRLKIKPGD